MEFSKCAACCPMPNVVPRQSGIRFRIGAVPARADQADGRTQFAPRGSAGAANSDEFGSLLLSHRTVMTRMKRLCRCVPADAQAMSISQMRRCRRPAHDMTPRKQRTAFRPLSVFGRIAVLGQLNTIDIKVSTGRRTLVHLHSLMSDEAPTRQSRNGIHCRRAASALVSRT